MVYFHWYVYNLKINISFNKSVISLHSDSSFPAQPNDTARLESSLIPPLPNTKCLVFYFHMYGMYSVYKNK